ncbi:hypothetical protein FACS1894188_10360 [Clostridia bacterium]|nr:hypothetical protein FACS1894188_10360 [Clostridia bacterium]
MAAVVALTQSVYAGTLDDVLGLYGTSTNIADADRVRTELDRANAAYRAVRGDLSKDEYFMLMGEIAKENVSNPVRDAVTSEKYLVSLVGVGAGLEMIFDAEAEYRKALGEIGQVAMKTTARRLGTCSSLRWMWTGLSSMAAKPRTQR